MSLDYHQMFKDLVNADVIGYGGGNEKGTGFSAGVTYTQIFWRCFTGGQILESFDDLNDLHCKWRAHGAGGVIWWLATKEKYQPMRYVKETFPDIPWENIGLPENPNDAQERKLMAELEEMKAKNNEKF